MPTSGRAAKTWVVRSPEDLGRALAGVRKARGIKQAALAEDIGVYRSYLAKLESGAASPLVIVRVLRALRQSGATVLVTLDERDA